MQPEHFNRSAKHWKRSILETGPVNSGPNQQGQVNAFGSKPPVPQGWTQNSRMNMHMKTKHNQKLVLAATIGFAVFTVAVLFGNVVIFSDMMIAHPYGFMAPLSEICAALFVIWSFTCAWRLLRTDPPMAILLACIGGWMWADRSLLATAYYLKW